MSAGRHVALLGHIILLSSQPVFALSPSCCMISGEATNSNCIAFGLSRPGINHFPIGEWLFHNKWFYTIMVVGFVLFIFFLLQQMNLYIKKQIPV
jgi:TRAP-type C4-dicarboxylate transport system permease small subunit